MKVLIQRVLQASVTVEYSNIGAIEKGLLVFVGIGKRDTEKELEWMVAKLLNLRIFPDAEGKMNLNIQEVSGELLVVSQFTLYGNTNKGNRPSFASGAPPEDAERLYDKFVEILKAQSPLKVETGQFAAHMLVSLVNDGPVTLWLESPVERS